MHYQQSLRAPFTPYNVCAAGHLSTLTRLQQFHPRVQIYTANAMKRLRSLAKAQRRSHRKHICALCGRFYFFCTHIIYMSAGVCPRAASYEKNVPVCWQQAPFLILPRRHTKMTTLHAHIVLYRKISLSPDHCKGTE